MLDEHKGPTGSFCRVAMRNPQANVRDQIHLTQNEQQQWEIKAWNKVVQYNIQGAPIGNTF